MSPSELLHLIVEASLALAGFAGVVNALSARGGATRPSRLRHLNLVNLLATSFAALFLSLGSLAMLAASVEESLIWRIASAAGLLTTLYFAIRSVRTVSSVVGSQRARSSSELRAINIPLSVVCIGQLWNAVFFAAFWPFFVLLIALFGIGCFSFVRLLISPADEQP